MPGARDAVTEPIESGDLQIDFERRTVMIRRDTVQLTYVEFEILAALARAPGRVLLARDAARARLG